MIAIAGGKGGCGKTTSALGLGRALAVAGEPVRVVDVDSDMPNLHRLADVERDPGLRSVVEEPDRQPQRDDFGVEIVPAPRALDDLDVGDCLDRLDERDRRTVLDCPAGAGPAAATPLRAASDAILVSTDRPESAEDAAKTAEMARQLDVRIVGAVVTRTERVPEEVADQLGVSRTLAVPERASPLEDPVVQDHYSTLAEWVRRAVGSDNCTAAWKESPGEPTSATTMGSRAGNSAGTRNGTHRTSIEPTRRS